MGAALLSLLDVIYWSSRQQPGLPLIFYFVQLYYHCLMSSINLQGSNQGCHSFSVSCSSTIIAWCHLLIFKAATRAATHFLFRAALLSFSDVIYWSSRQQPGLPLIFYFVQLYYHCLMSSINLQGSNQGSTHFLFRAALLSLLDVIYWSSRQQPGLPLIFYFNIPWLFPDFSPFSRHFRRPPNSPYSCPQPSNLPIEHLLSENWTII